MMYAMLSGCYFAQAPRPRPIDSPVSDRVLVGVWADGRVESLLGSAVDDDER